MDDLADETERALRRVCDRYIARAGADPTPCTLEGLVRSVIDTLPSGAFEGVALSPSGTGDYLPAARLSPAFHRYVTYAAEYWALLSREPSHETRADRTGS